MVAAGFVKLVVFLRDTLTAHSHDPDIHALMKVCDVQRVPLATNAATARPSSEPGSDGGERAACDCPSSAANLG